MMKKTMKRAVLLGLALVLLICLFPTEAASAAGSSGSKITVSFRLIGAEKAKQDVDLGADPYLPAYVTWIPTVEYEMNAGATVYDLWVLATGNAGIRSIGADRNYIKTVYAPESLGGYALSEFTNGRRSGWMYTVNGSHPGFGLKDQTLYNGDTVVWHYVSDYSYEVSDWHSEGQWQALGDGTYYNLWLNAQDRFGGVSPIPFLTGATASPGQITVKWNAVSGATKYAVYRKAAGETSWTRLTKSFKGTTYTDNSTDLVAGTTYYYTVKAYVNSEWSGYDRAGVNATASAIPVLIGATATAGKIIVQWNTVNGATKYAVYRKAAGETSWTRLTKSFKGTTYTDSSTDLVAGTTYYYTVKAYVNSKWSGYDKVGVSAIASAIPVLIGATATAGKITVQWNTVNGATKYAVYRKAAGETSWTRLTKTFKGTTYTDKSTDLVAGTTYYYTVKAYVNSKWSGYDKSGVSAKAK